jgi:membrane protein DedA with SNARE-associated domain
MSGVIGFAIAIDVTFERDMLEALQISSTRVDELAEIVFAAIKSSAFTHDQIEYLIGKIEKKEELLIAARIYWEIKKSHDKAKEISERMGSG